jgi:hypothetical protein
MDQAWNVEGEAFMRRMIGIGAAVALAVLAGIVWNIMLASTRDAQAITSPSVAVSPMELTLQIDMQTLPVQEIEDPV